MDSRTAAALLSTLVSQIGLLIPLLFPPSSVADPSGNTNSYQQLINALINHFMSTAESAVSLSILPSKRRRTDESDSSSEAESPGKGSTWSTRLRELGRVDPIILQEPDAFRLFFKMTPSAFEWICGLLDPLLDCRDPVGSPLNLSSELRFGIGIYRLSSGSDFAEIADRFKVSEGVARFCAHQLCRVLCTNFRYWVSLPNANELKSVSEGFESQTGLPNCCGVIDCVRFKFKRTDSDTEESIATQIVVDSNLKVLNIVVGYHGRNSDTKILKSSALYKDIERGILLNAKPIDVEGVAVPQYLVGHSGYPIHPWLMVPFNEPSFGSVEEKFNSSCHMMHASMAKIINSLRSWGILSRPLEGEYRNAVASIGSCAILHNFLLMREDYPSSHDWVGDDLIRDNGSRQCGAEEESIEKRACDIRNALAKNNRTSLTC